MTTTDKNAERQQLDRKGTPLSIPLAFLANVFGSAFVAIWAVDTTVFGIFVASNALFLAAALYFSATSNAHGVKICCLAPVPAAVLSVVLLAVVGETGYERHWIEEVNISKDKKITVQRGESRKRGSLVLNGSWIETDLGEFGRLRWDTSLIPWMLDRSNDGAWYLVGLSTTYRGGVEYGLHDPEGRNNDKRFVAYRLEGTSWKRIVATEFPQEFIGPNLLVYSEKAFEESQTSLRNDLIANGGMVSLERKARSNASDFPEEKQLYRVTRELFDEGRRRLPGCRPAAPGCEPIILESGLDSRFGRPPVQVARSK